MQELTTINVGGTQFFAEFYVEDLTGKQYLSLTEICREAEHKNCELKTFDFVEYVA